MLLIVLKATAASTFQMDSGFIRSRSDSRDGGVRSIRGEYWAHHVVITRNEPTGRL